tara:strand:- start:2022 stop:2462 length:441 start_codon:yes stop_codon:yes gene_type:complete
MPFEIPAEQFDATEHARNKAIRSNQFLEMVLTQFTSAYEEFWGVSGSMQDVKDINGDPVLDGNGNPTQEFVGDGSRYTLDEMQSVIVALGAAVTDILTQTATFTQFLNTAYPGVLADRYQQAAFNYDTSTGVVVLTGINDFWAQKA